MVSEVLQRALGRAPQTPGEDLVVSAEISIVLWSHATVVIKDVRVATAAVALIIESRWTLEPSDVSGYFPHCAVVPLEVHTLVSHAWLIRMSKATVVDDQLLVPARSVSKVRNVFRVVRSLHASETEIGLGFST